MGPEEIHLASHLLNFLLVHMVARSDFRRQSVEGGSVGKRFRQRREQVHGSLLGLLLRLLHLRLLQGLRRILLLLLLMLLPRLLLLRRCQALLLLLLHLELLRRRLELLLLSLGLLLLFLLLRLLGLLGCRLPFALA